ncbi:MAG: hypothetical protein SFV20_14755 [Sphingopyxis sp.]|nr:hypothetical protein [Sphingopyxis sp.]
MMDAAIMAVMVKNIAFSCVIAFLIGAGRLMQQKRCWLKLVPDETSLHSL